MTDLHTNLDVLEGEVDAAIRAMKLVMAERDALQAALHDLLTGPTLGFSPATADRMIADTLQEARGEP